MMSSGSDTESDRMDLRSGKQVSSNTGARMKENSYNYRFQNTFKPTQRSSLLFPNDQKSGEARKDTNKYVQGKFPQDVGFSGTNNRNENTRARNPTKEGPQPRGFSAPGAVGLCPPNMPFPQMRNDQVEEFEQFKDWKMQNDRGRSYANNASYKRSIMAAHEKEETAMDLETIFGQDTLNLLPQAIKSRVSEKWDTFLNDFEQKKEKSAEERNEIGKLNMNYQSPHVEISVKNCFYLNLRKTLQILGR